MKIYTLHYEQYLPITMQEAWEFFSSAKNLARITPPDMGFIIKTKLTSKPVYAGMKIEYIIKPLFHIPMHWTTEIAEVNAPFRFVDKQLKGPYALWEHTHTFEQVNGGVKMTDQVRYALPFGIAGRIAHTLLVHKKLKHIFDFRRETLVSLFGRMDNK